MRESKKENGSKGNTYKEPCVKCHFNTNHEVVASIDIYREEKCDRYLEIDSYQIIKCLGCETISFRTDSSNSEEYYYEEIDGDCIYDSVVRLYPSRISGWQGLSDDELQLVPGFISSVYKEVRQALNDKSFVLCGVGLRAIVEYICRHEKVGEERDNLAKKIGHLEKDGMVPSKVAKTLHMIRNIGNDSIHDAKRYSEEEIKLAAKIIDHLLTYFYIMTSQANSIYKSVTGDK